MRQATEWFARAAQRLRPVSSRVVSAETGPCKHARQSDNRRPCDPGCGGLRCRPCMKPPTMERGALPDAGSISQSALFSSGRRAQLQAVCAFDAAASTHAAPAHAARLHAESRRLCARHARESMGREQRLAGCLSRADSTRERAPLLELVSPERPASRPRSQRSSPASSGRSSTNIRSMRDVSMSLACRQAARWLPSWRMNIPNCLPPSPSIRVCRWARHATSDQRLH